MAKSRIGFLDVAKGIAMISIILGHLHISSVNAVVYTYHIPVFLLISGYFTSRKRSLAAFAGNRFGMLMAPYFVTCAVLIALATLLGLRSGTAMLQLDKWSRAAIYGSGNMYTKPFDIRSIGAIWFLPASCIAAILFRCILQLPEKWHPPVVGALFAAGYFSSVYLFWFPMSIQAGCCLVLYLYIGWLFRENEERIRSLSPGIRISAVLFGVLVWFFFIRRFDEIKGFYLVKNYYGRGIMDIFSSVCAGGVVILLSYAIDRKTKILSRFLRFFGRYSLLILCVHVVEHCLSEYKLLTYKNLFLRVFAKLNQMFPGFLNLNEESYKYVMIVFKPAVVLVIVWLLLKLRPVRKLFGYESEKA